MPNLEQPESTSNSLQLYPDAVYEGARVLSMDVKFVATCYDAVQLVYNRRYSRGQGGLRGGSASLPDSALGPIGKVLIYQALMLENLDFSFEKQYELAAKQARQPFARSTGGERKRCLGKLHPGRSARH